MIARPPLDVSRETSEMLEQYVEILKKWTRKINLISPSSIPDIWQRHILDSIQVFHAVPGEHRVWLDLGSGGGLPGLVVAILAKEHSPKMRTVLIESDIRKATFLRTVIRELGLNAECVNRRIEVADAVGADVISARALGSLDMLLGFADRHMLPDGQAVFSKGENWQKEVDNARKSWRFYLDVVQSKTEKQAAILKIGGIARV